MKKWILLILLTSAWVAQASDHDDGELDLKGRSLNITDVYAFREDNQTGNAADSGNLILIMNTNPRSLPGQQYYFSTQALYDFHLSRVKAADKTKPPTGSDDIVLRFQFAAPDSNNQQAISVSLIKDGQASSAKKKALTTTLNQSKSGQIINNKVRLANRELTVFAGLRQDPFFFDVTQFFKVRDAAVKTGQFIGFLPANQAKDFTHNYNVNTIVARVPIALLQTSAAEPVFDVWTTISVPQ